MRQPPLFRQPVSHLLLVLLACLAPLILAIGAPLGEPCAEDFDFLYYSIFHPHGWTLLDGGGSASFWRPLPHQLYYALAGRLLLTAPLIVALCHAGLLVLTGLLLYHAYCRVTTSRTALIASSLPFLASSARMLITWPTLFVEVGLLLGTALALLGLTRGSILLLSLGTLVALASKESGALAVGFLVTLWVLRSDNARRHMLTRIFPGAILALWAVIYLSVRLNAHLHLPHHLESTHTTSPAVIKRALWALGNSLRATVSIGAGTAGGDMLAILIAAAVLALLVRAQRSRFGAVRRSIRNLATLGLIWFLATSLLLTTVYPFWAPDRVIFGALGLALTLAALSDRLAGWIAWPLVVVPLVGLVLARGPSTDVPAIPTDTKAFIDFQQVTRLQVLMRATRTALKARWPDMPRHSVVVSHYMPQRAQYAYGGNHALRVWYGDTTLTWVPFDAYLDGSVTPRVFVEFQPNRALPIALVAPEAMRQSVLARTFEGHGDWMHALESLRAARRLLWDRSAYVFNASLDYRMAWAFAATGSADSAEIYARRAVARGVVDANARYTLALILASEERWPEARAEVDSLLVEFPEDSDGRALKRALESR